MVNTVLRKGTKGKELDPKKFNDEEREAFNEADADQWITHIRTGAVAIIPPDKTKYVDRSRILRLPFQARADGQEQQTPGLGRPQG